MGVPVRQQVSEGPIGVSYRAMGFVHDPEIELKVTSTASLPEHGTTLVGSEDDLPSTVRKVKKALDDRSPSSRQFLVRIRR